MLHHIESWDHSYLHEGLFRAKDFEYKKMKELKWIESWNKSIFYRTLILFLSLYKLRTWTVNSCTPTRNNGMIIPLTRKNGFNFSTYALEYFTAQTKLNAKVAA